MNGFYIGKDELLNPHIIMDNDSGYVSNNLDQESNSDSILDSSDTSTVGILRSFFPKEKPIFLSEDALLECPDTYNKFTEETLMSDLQSNEYSPEIVINSSVLNEETYLPSFNSSTTETEVSDSSVIIPIVNPIYFDLNTKLHSNAIILDCEKETFGSDMNFDEDEGNRREPIFNFDVPKEVPVIEDPLHKLQCPDFLKNVKTIGSFSKSQSCNSDMDCATEMVPLCLIQETPSSSVQDNSTLVKPLDTRESYTPNEKKFELKNLQMSPNPCYSVEHSKGSSTKKHALGLNFETNILSNVTNTCDNTNSVETSNKIVIRRRTISLKEKENISQPEVFKTPKKGMKRKFNESLSPDLFSDDENIKYKHLPSPKIIEERYVHKLDHILLKRVQRKLSGVPPPPEFTITNFSVDTILQKLEENKTYFWTKENITQNEKHEMGSLKSTNENQNCSFGSSGSILVEGPIEDVMKKEFPEVLESRHHGLHHNRNKLSEEIEHLCDKYAKRYIGAETQSTCCAVEKKYSSPTKRKTIKQKWATKSPGRRLSHLARRRITFSSANLQAGSSTNAASRARQILIDYKKVQVLNHKMSPRKSPRKTPNKSPSQGRTPSSSAKKKLRMRFRLLSGDFKETAAGPSSSIASSKRALFQSPDNGNKFRNILSNASSNSFNEDLNNRGIKRSLFTSPSRLKSKGSLFSSPNKKSPFKNVSCFEKKRKRDESDDMSDPSRFLRSQSATEVIDTYSQLPFSKAKSDGVLSSQPVTDLSAAHKKKLQWAVYESLKHQNINMSNPNFKTFASVLARVTRRFILASNIRLEGGTSERMLRIARHHSFAVVKGKSVDEIMNEYNKNKAKSFKPQGYIAPEDNERRQNNKEFSASKESALKDRSNTGDSLKNVAPQSTIVKPVSRIDRIRKVINFEDNR
ncbi:hypothetical protein WA026_019036 [Henosepilachna vigintioctopunctata]|uniref:Uncharacterized protein n=1 Tax=Henosepilachna vigintioctopunctata TaxID=420089 RepID=A0AAW1VI97_9CUCU